MTEFINYFKTLKIDEIIFSDLYNHYWKWCDKEDKTIETRMKFALDIKGLMNKKRTKKGMLYSFNDFGILYSYNDFGCPKKFIKEFLKDAVMINDILILEMSATDLYKKYCGWCSENNVSFCSNTKFALDIKGLINKKRSKKGMLYSLVYIPPSTTT